MSDQVVPPWLVIARGELGVKEWIGDASNPRVEEYQAAANGREDDAVPWCSSFTCWVMEQAGLGGTKSGAARSWMRWGVPIKEARVGSVVVLWREQVGGYKGHVGLLEREDEKGLWLLSGNAANAVCVRPFPRRRLLGFRWPSEAMLAAARPG